MSPNKMKIGLILCVLTLMTACSSAKPKEDEDVLPPSAEAGTDALPPSSDAPQGVLSTPQGTPDMTPSGSSASTIEGTPEPYTVEKGQTLMKIAYEVYGDAMKWKEIYEANRDKISNPNAIKSGMVLTVIKPTVPISTEKAGEKYEIRPGETLGTISNQIYGTPSKWRDLYEYNKDLIHDPNRIFAGFFLYYVKDGSVMPQAGAAADPGSVTPAVPQANLSPVTPDAGVQPIPAPINDPGSTGPAPMPPAGQ